MLKVENRESAHIRSRVKDLSVVPNGVSFNALLAAITPITKLSKNADSLYEPILIRDSDTLINNFGDPRVDPEKFIDLYSALMLVKNGGTCYLAKVDSGTAGTYQLPIMADLVHAEIDKTPITLTKDSDTVYSAKVKNKCIVTDVKKQTGVAEKDDGTATSFLFVTEPIEVLDNAPVADADNVGNVANNTTENSISNYTWECTALETEDDAGNRFSLKITLNEAIKDDESLNVYCNVDPNWGSENIKVVAEEPTANVKEITLKSTVNLENKYILLESTLEKLKATLTVGTDDAAKTPTIEYSFDGDNNLIIKAVYEEEVTLEAAQCEAISIEGTTRAAHSLIAYSSMNEDITFNISLMQAKPYSIKAYYLVVEAFSSNGTNSLGQAKVKLESTTTNQGIVNAINSVLGSSVKFELTDPETASACGVKERGANSIAQTLLDTYCNTTLKSVIKLEPAITLESPTFEVSVNNYIDALKQYKERKYVGCLMADMVCPVTKDVDEESATGYSETHTLYPLNQSDRRSLHYHMKDIAYERKDTTVILSTPYTSSWNNLTAFTINDACDWVASQGTFADLWEYGQGATTDYATQSFYLEMYYSWLEMTCDWVVSGNAKSKKVKVAPSNLVINNILTSWRERGVQYPVAGDQYGILPDTCVTLMNPKTKLERDQLVQYRINPIWDTGTRGVQIFGNETLNGGYTDLNAAHIARTLVYIRSAIDEYTEKLKFSINNLTLWDKWKLYVTQYILEPLKAVNALKEYRVAMGEDTTSKEEIANRTINGVVELIFNQSAEIFDLTYTVYSSSTTIEEATANS